MAIYTAYGETVDIINSRIEQGNSCSLQIITVKSIHDPNWIRERFPWELRADGGIEEIDRAVNAVLEINT